MKSGLNAGDWEAIRQASANAGHIHQETAGLKTLILHQDAFGGDDSNRQKASDLRDRRPDPQTADYAGWVVEVDSLADDIGRRFLKAAKAKKQRDAKILCKKVTKKVFVSVSLGTLARALNDKKAETALQSRSARTVANATNSSAGGPAEEAVAAAAAAATAAAASVPQ